MPRFQAIRDVIRKLGFPRALLYATHRALGAFGGGKLRMVAYELWAQPVAAKPALPERRAGSFTIRQLTAGDPLLGELDRPDYVIESRFKQGGICLAALKGDEVAGYIWLNLGPYDEDEVRCRFVPQPDGQCAWDYDVYIAPAYRGGFVFVRLWDAANELMRARGIKWTMSRISSFNLVSQASHRRLGGCVVGSAYFLVLGAVQLMIVSSPRLQIALTRTRRPIVKVTPP